MDGIPTSSAGWGASPRAARRWIAHARHDAAARPHRPGFGREVEERAMGSGMVTLDGSKGEGGGQILRTSLSLSMLTGRPFHIRRIRANRDKPGLRPQHLAAVEAAALLCGAEVSGGSIGSRELIFRPGPIRARDFEFAIGTAGSTALVLQTLHLPIALRAETPVRVVIAGGTFNTKAPSFPFLESCWRPHLAAMGLPISLRMTSAGFYPRGEGKIEAWIEPATPRPVSLTERGPLVRIRGVAGTSRLRHGDVAARMASRAADLLAEHDLEADIELADWPGVGPGAAIALTAEYASGPATFVGLGERGKPAEAVAAEAVAELLAFEGSAGAVDPHSADQLLLPLALADGRSEYTVSEVTEHLRTNAATIRAFLEREIAIEGPGSGDAPGRVAVRGSGIMESS